jgi:hypothetical protein
MARKRMLSPEMFSSESVTALPFEARWTWAGLLCYLDDTGRGKDSARAVRGSVYSTEPEVTVEQVAGHLDLIVGNGSLCRYSCCGEQFHAPSWGAWQKPQHPTPTRLCPCPVHEPEAAEVHVQELSRGLMNSREPSRAAREGYGSTLRNVVEVNEVEGSSSECPHGLAYETCRNARCRIRLAG